MVAIATVSCHSASSCKIRGSYSWEDGLKQSLVVVGGGVRPDLTVDVVDKPRKMIRSGDTGGRKGKMTNCHTCNVCVKDVKLSKNLDTASTVDSIEKLPETPVIHNIYGRGRTSVRRKKFWTGSNVDSYDSSMDYGGSEESSHDEEAVELSDQSQVSSQQRKQYHSPHTPKHNSFIAISLELSPFHQQTTLQAVTPRTGRDRTAMVPTPPSGRQATLQVTPRISRTVIPAMSRLNSKMSGNYNSQEYPYTLVRSGVGGAAHDIAASGSAEDSSGMAVKNAAVATRNDTKLRSILNSTSPFPRSPRLSSLGSDRGGGGQAIPEFSLWKKKWPGNDGRKQNHKTPSNFASALLNNSPTATLGGGEAAVFLKATSSCNSLLSSEQSLHNLGDNFYQFPGEQYVCSSSSSSRPINPYATRASPSPQHHNVFSSSHTGEGGGDSIFGSTSNIMTISKNPSSFTLPHSGDGVNEKSLQQQNIPIISSGGGGSSSSNSLDARINRDSNVQHQEMISHLLPDVSDGTNAECSSPNRNLSWESFLNKHQAAQDGLESNSTHSQRPRHHHTTSEDLVKSQRLGKCDDALPWIDTGATKTRRSESSICIDKGRLSLDRSNIGFGSPITALLEAFHRNQTTTNSMMNETVGVHPETTAESQRKVRSSTAGFRGRSNERQKMNTHRRVSRYVVLYSACSTS